MQIELFIEWFGLEGTSKIIKFQLPCNKQGHLSLDQSPIKEAQSSQASKGTFFNTLSYEINWKTLINVPDLAKGEIKQDS